MSTPSDSSTLSAARHLLACGISCIPIGLDGEKRPVLSTWKRYQAQSPSQAEVTLWFGGRRRGLAAIGGEVSGFLEIIDADDRQTALAWRDLVAEQAPDLLGRLVIVRTPRPGFHFWYRCPEGIEGNQKLARRRIGTTDDGKPNVKAMIETRGEGGYVLVPGGAPEAHETGRPYELVQGSFDAIPVITAEERALLLECARALNEYADPPQAESAGSRPAHGEGADGTRPGDDFNRQADMAELLRRHGWICTRSDGQVSYWRRPGKQRGHSATLGKVAPGILYVFSVNALPLESDRSYDAFGVYALLEHEGDFHAAARALVAQGYGRPGESTRRRIGRRECSSALRREPLPPAVKPLGTSTLRAVRPAGCPNLLPPAVRPQTAPNTACEVTG